MFQASHLVQTASRSFHNSICFRVVSDTVNIIRCFSTRIVHLGANGRHIERRYM